MRGLLCAMILLGVTSMSVFGAEHRSLEVTSYTADMDIVVDGASVVKPAITAEFGKEVELTVGAKPGKSGWKIRVIADNPVITKDMETAVLTRLQLFEVVDGSEILRAEPELTARPNERVDFDLPMTGAPGRRATIGLTLDLAAEDMSTESLSDAMGVDENCPVHQKSLIGTDGARQCCGGRCPDGEPWTCCGAIKCCLCGSCCNP